MGAAFERRLATVLLILSAITVASWWIGTRHGADAGGFSAPISFGVMAIAALKVRLILMEFMEARHAPRLLRRLVDAWLVLLFASLFGIYAIGMSLRV